MINSKSSEPEDRLSELPDSLILLIFEFLPLKEVIRTTILSNRRKNLWTTIPCLTFKNDLMDDSIPLSYLTFIDDLMDDSMSFHLLTLDDNVMDFTDKFPNFVNGALKFWRGIRMLKFKLDLYRKLHKSLFSDIDSWLHFATENEVEELYLRFPYPYHDELGGRDSISSEEVYWVPQFLYSCSSLKVLSFESCNIEIHDTVQWNQLKSLTIGGFGYGVTEKMINQVLCGSPHLEVFHLTCTEGRQDLNIQSSSLKKLLISKSPRYCNEFLWMDTVMRIWTPNLETLEISGVPYGECLLMDVSSLTHAILGHFYPPAYESWFPWNDFLGERLRQIFPTIQHVEKVTLSHWCIKVVAAMIKKDPLPPLSNVNFLELNICCFVEYKQILECLEIFPQVKMLVLLSVPYINTTTCREHNIDESCLKFETNPPNSFLLQLRTVEVTLTKGENSVFPFIEYLLKQASQLEKMVFRKRWLCKTYDAEVFFLGITASADEILRQMQIYLNC